MLFVVAEFRRIGEATKQARDAAANQEEHVHSIRQHRAAAARQKQQILEREQKGSLLFYVVVFKLVC